MAELQQLVYISRAAFAASREGLGVEPEIGRILVQSRLNNPRRGLVGGLYYGDGCFFQCLEGPPDALDALYVTLMSDPRHRDLKILHRRNIGSTSFSDWAMKYVPGANDVRALMKKHGLSRFDPYRFDPATVRDMVELLQRGAQGMPDKDSVAAAPRESRRKRTFLFVALGMLVLVAAALVWLH